MALLAVVLVGGILAGSATHQARVLVDGDVYFVSVFIERRAWHGAATQKQR